MRRRYSNEGEVAWAATAKVILIVLTLVVGSAATVVPEDVAVKLGKPDKATGTVQVMLPANGSPKGEKPALVELEWFEGTEKKPARGALVLTMLDAFGQPKRSITAQVTDHPNTGVAIDPDAARAWFVGEVVDDVKLHSDCHGHDDGTTHDDGCTGHDDATTHDDGCTGHDGTNTPDDGCTGHYDTTTHDGCTGHDDTTTDGGTTHDGGCARGSSGSGGAHVSGKDSRVGQLIVVKVHDVASPGSAGDGITWKWFFGDPELAPSVDNTTAWPHLCKKAIVAGNLVVHR